MFQIAKNHDQSTYENLKELKKFFKVILIEIKIAELKKVIKFWEYSENNVRRVLLRHYYTKNDQME